jgi:chemotaxis protein CheY-P-specific phosphatase CheC
MDLQTRKLEFIKEILKIKSEKVLVQLEKLLSKEHKLVVDEVYPMTIEELNNRVDKSEEDFKNNKFSSTSDLLNRYK